MWLEGNIASSAVGSLIAVLDTELVKNACWEIFDANAWLAPPSVVTNGDFSAGNTGWTVGANWSTASGAAVHTPGSTATMSQSVTIKPNTYYTVTFTVTSAASTVSVTHNNLTGALGAVGAGTWTYVGLSSSISSTVTITPNTLFNGSIDDISIVQYNNGNCKVYHCSGGSGVNCEFYMLVDDEHLNFAYIELWEGWNAGTHQGIGANIKYSSGGATYTLRINRYAGFYKISLHDNYFTFINKDYSAAFVGRPNLYDDSPNVVMICCDSYAAGRYNHVAQWAGNTEGGWEFLFDHTGNRGKAISEGGVSTPTYIYSNGIDNQIHCEEFKVVVDGSKLLIGTLPGIMTIGPNSGMAYGDNLIIDGVDHFVCAGEPSGTLYWAAIRKD